MRILKEKPQKHNVEGLSGSVVSSFYDKFYIVAFGLSLQHTVAPTPYKQTHVVSTVYVCKA